MFRLQQCNTGVGFLIRVWNPQAKGPSGSSRRYPRWKARDSSSSYPLEEEREHSIHGPLEGSLQKQYWPTEAQKLSYDKTQTSTTRVEYPQLQPPKRHRKGGIEIRNEKPAGQTDVEEVNSARIAQTRTQKPTKEAGERQQYGTNRVPELPQIQIGHPTCHTNRGPDFP